MYPTRWDYTVKEKERGFVLLLELPVCLSPFRCLRPKQPVVYLHDSVTRFCRDIKFRVVPGLSWRPTLYTKNTVTVFTVYLREEDLHHTERVVGVHRSLPCERCWR